jgi:hypothetical protein
VVKGKETTRACISKEEWEAVRRQHGFRCGLCGESERHVPLHKVHIPVLKKSGQHIVPLCPNCHSRYGEGMLDESQVEKLGLTWEIYQRCVLKKKAKTEKAKKIESFGT